ncbi:ATP-dependent RNA helicase MRH4, mitochondrial [Papiliotrema laurentii]|uniref:ATP-dependent RNA helicase n=1 Tax=Papiliotrema laurentii TaxID=5418 RepID=A0AAD9FNU7_PAPLA|nr:ATP-dependent RNA helicase MRH4, mitochondrial [Papiliotrema laurentii]
MEVPEPTGGYGFVYHPRARAFKPNTYQVPETAASEAEAAPAKFESFPMHPALVDTLKQRYGESAETTYIQSLALSHLCPEAPARSRTILGAETGSGKTLAYLLPLMTNLKATEMTQPTDWNTDKGERRLLPRALVLQPTHELTRQSTAMAKSMIHGIKLSATGMSNTKAGGTNLRSGPVDILFGTGAMTRRMFGIRKPGMTLEEGYEKTEWVGADRIDWLVIDEADVLLSKDFRQETMLILQHITSQRPDVNIILCTATFPPSLLNLLKSHEELSDNPFVHLLSPKLHKLPRNLEARFVPRSRGDLISDVTHEVKRVMTEDAIKRKHMLAQGKNVDKSKMIVFCNTDSRVQAVSEALTAKGIDNLTWMKEGENRRHGSSGPLKSFLLDPKVSVDEAMSPAAADKSKVKSGEPDPRVLVTTGILSRGLDFSPLISTVFLVDQPKDILDFVHRAGRAGRAGRKGRVVIFGQSQGRRAEDGRLGSAVRSVMRDNVQDQRETWKELRLKRLELFRGKQKEWEEMQAKRQGKKIIRRPGFGWKKEAPGYGLVKGEERKEHLEKKYGVKVEEPQPQEERLRRY